MMKPKVSFLLSIFIFLFTFFLFSEGQRISNSLDDLDLHDVLNESIQDDKVSRRVDPHVSWLRFISRKNKSQGKQRKRRKKNKLLLAGQQGPPGQQGPSGPPGPRGPPGAQVTLDTLMDEFRKHVTAEADRRVEQVLHSKCPTCYSNGFKSRNETLQLLELGELEVVPRVTVGFHASLKDKIKVSGRTFLELDNYQFPMNEGAVKRGNDLDFREGRFMAKKSGIYHFIVNLHLSKKFRQSSKDHRKIRRRDNIRILVCIQSLCQKHMSLEHISPLYPDIKISTTSFSGILSLKEGQYASIYIDNSSTQQVSILQGSTFTGLLMGV